MRKDTFVFVAGPPKPATQISIQTLKKTLSEVNRIESAKLVGSGTIKLFMSGRVNHYLLDTPALRALLRKHRVSEP